MRWVSWPDYELYDRRIGVQFPVKAKNFIFTPVHAALQPTQPPDKWMPMILSQKIKSGRAF
jgi:hypothetical protein